MAFFSPQYGSDAYRTFIPLPLLPRYPPEYTQFLGFRYRFDIYVSVNVLIHASILSYAFALCPGAASTAFKPNRLFFSCAILLCPHALSFAAIPTAINAFTPYVF